MNRYRLRELLELLFTTQNTMHRTHQQETYAEANQAFYDVLAELAKGLGDQVSVDYMLDPSLWPELEMRPALQPAYEGDAGVDIYAASDVLIDPHETQTVLTGLHVAIPAGFEGQVRGRSGLARKHGIEVLNAPGTIDCQYRGAIGIILHNTSSVPYDVERGDRVAQLVVQRIPSVAWNRVAALDESERGDKGFGSSGR